MSVGGLGHRVQKKEDDTTQQWYFIFCPGKSVSALRKVLLSYRRMDDTECMVTYVLVNDIKQATYILMIINS